MVMVRQPKNLTDWLKLVTGWHFSTWLVATCQEGRAHLIWSCLRAGARKRSERDRSRKEIGKKYLCSADKLLCIMVSTKKKKFRFRLDWIETSTELWAVNAWFGNRPDHADSHSFSDISNSVGHMLWPLTCIKDGRRISSPPTVQTWS